MGCRVALGTEHWGKRAEKDDSSEVRGVQPGWLVRWSESSTCSSFCAGQVQVVRVVALALDHTLDRFGVRARGAAESAGAPT